MKKLALLLLIALTTIIDTYGQKLIPIGDNFLYGENYIDKAQVKGIMQSNTEAYKYFAKSQDQFASAKGFGITSIVSLSSGLLIVMSSVPATAFSESAEKTAAFGGILILGGCISGTIGLVKKKRAKRNLKVSLLLYNQLNGEQENNTSYNLDLTFDGNRAGITYTF